MYSGRGNVEKYRKYLIIKEIAGPVPLIHF
jgi:hypothetical protein